MLSEPSTPSSISGTARTAQRGVSLITIILIIAVLGLAVWGVLSRIHARSALREQASSSSAIGVVVIAPTVAGKGEDLLLPGNVSPWSDAPIYARTSGYVRRWLVDIGSPVKAGQLLAELDTPEVDAQLSQAMADVDTAKANSSLAESTAKRWDEQVKAGVVAQQSADEKNGDSQAKRAVLASSQANLTRLRQLTGFKRITAPFDGVITARNIDVGALVTAGVGGAQELFHIANVDKLRIYVQVPQVYAGVVKTGLDAEVRFADRGNDRIPAKVTNTSSALDTASRTLRVQLEVDNAKGDLLPGGYADVHFKLPVRADSLRLPANTLLFRAAGLQLATVSSDDKVTLKSVTLGRDFGTTVEVIDGLNADDQVVLNPPDSLANGQHIRRLAPPKETTAKEVPKSPAEGEKKPEPAK